MAIIRKLNIRVGRTCLRHRTPCGLTRSLTGTCAVTFLRIFTGCLAGAVYLSGACLCADAAQPEAAETETAQENGTGQQGKTVSVDVTGDLGERQREKAVGRINEIRREACKEGIMDPRDGDALTMDDYVPLQWSAAMEEIAVIRAAEATVLQDHIRPSGEGCFTVNAEVAMGGQAGTGEETQEFSRLISADLETLAWGYGDILSSIEGWYSEKEAYQSSEGGVAGHYIALINPDVLYFGAADFTAYGQRDACAGEFSYSQDAGNAALSSKDGIRAEDESPGDGIRAEDESPGDGIRAEGESSGDGIRAEDESPEEGISADGGHSKEAGGSGEAADPAEGVHSLKIQIEVAADNLNSIYTGAVHASADRIAEGAAACMK